MPDGTLGNYMALEYKIELLERAKRFLTSKILKKILKTELNISIKLDIL